MKCLYQQHIVVVKQLFPDIYNRRTRMHHESMSNEVGSKEHDLVWAIIAIIARIQY